jgi:hypothetical protein
VESFQALRDEVPDAYAAMCARLAPRALALRVDGERVGIAFTRESASFPRAVDHPEVALDTTRATIMDVIDARHSLVSAVMSDVLQLRGRPADVLAFHDGLTAYVHGGVRAPSFRRLLAEFRADVRREVA